MQLQYNLKLCVKCHHSDGDVFAHIWGYSEFSAYILRARYDDVGLPHVSCVDDARASNARAVERICCSGAKLM